MSISYKNLIQLSKHLSRNDLIEIYRLAKTQEKLELKWKRKLNTVFDDLVTDLTRQFQYTGKIDFDKIDFTKFYVEHSIDIMKNAISGAKPAAKQKLINESKLPKNIKDLMKLWDQWRKGKIPVRQKSMANRVKKAYIKKLKDIFRKKGVDFIEGKHYDTQEVKSYIQEAANTTHSRAKMITETETTRYYNETRRKIYDSSGDVTHYLFMSIRDHATTKWCKTRNGLVYSKDDPLLKKETPPIHWNCRSEILPLTPLNQKHKALIYDPSKLRLNHTCEPLPKGWNE